MPFGALYLYRAGNRDAKRKKRYLVKTFKAIAKRTAEYIFTAFSQGTIMEKVNIEKKFALFNEQWKPKIVGELNGQHVKLGKIEGSFVWHQHENEDELFLVVKGKMRLEFQNTAVDVNEGEFIIVPRGIEHRPAADEECHILLFEPVSTLNTGNVKDELTVAEPEWI
jgi:mannose-6-phosphate isomerase-like protein (cupin superfamily)